MSKSNWYKWTLTNFGAKGFIIRRYRKVDSKTIWETYPSSNYKHLPFEEIEKLVKRLNFKHEQKEQEALKKYDYNSQYINPKTLSSFESFLKTRSNRIQHVNALMGCLHQHTFKFFITTSKLPDPNLWKRQEHEFGKYLLKLKLSAAHITRITQTTNRFIRFLHEQYQDEVRLFELAPVSLHVLKDIKTTNTDRIKYINEAHYKTICKNVDAKILPAIKLAYNFGLRRSEVLGLNEADVYEDSLAVERQLNKLVPVKSYKSLKNKEKRDVEYWFCSPEETFSLIKNLEQMHPDTLGDLFLKEMKKLNLPYQFHDLRRTFITNALRKYHYRDVQLAAGHSDLKTTQRYAQDDRRLSRKRYRP